ncbi:Glucose-1-phosphate adenylyltransferase [Sulfidibacter corallicola]|uniref:Glucose-1-phosphate adenylyltransferase n=1 Tax=Sulfidibacter corallicola TaxID=2818388 RepID=A0A8A4U050_SULCO|nr:sugar phosphate nucleotidyltransferase [Sulfidibacter corallicola]QTD52125.1 NTP transferase domain-containing protein [Sulfidibacter corallicola]
MKVKAIVLAGGRGTRLAPLTLKRAKPAVPFAGKYRIIDFTLSNCVNSNIFDILIITQYRPHSLNEHIRNGRPWDLDRGFTGGVHLLHPFQGLKEKDWYAGTADAVLQNLNFVRHGVPDLVLVVSGDHVYKMDYTKLIRFHQSHGADATVCTVHVPLDQANRFGILEVGEEQRIEAFIEKPEDPRSTLASMGVYLFNYKALERALIDDGDRRDSSHDFGRDLIPHMLRGGTDIRAFPFSGYWVDVGMVDTYWQAQMDLLRRPPAMDLNDRNWVIHTRSEERPPTRIARGAEVANSLIANGVVISKDAIVEDSIFSPGVFVGPGARIRQSVLLSDAHIGAESVVDRCIIDKIVATGERSTIGRIEEGDGLGITCIGKSTHLPQNLVVGRGARIGTDLTPEDFAVFESGTVPDHARVGFEPGRSKLY